MHISNERYFHERQRHDLALRMIRHEARTCTIRSCTGLTDDRIRRLYKTYASHMPSAPVRRRRGKSPRQVAFFVRNARAQLESSMLASVFATFGLWRRASRTLDRIPVGSIEYGRLFCDAYETHRQLLRNADISFEHAWFLLQLLSRNARPARGALPTLRQPVPAGSHQHVSSRVPGVRAEANARTERR